MNPNTTVKIHGGLLQLAENEVSHYRDAFLKAYDVFIANRTPANQTAMNKAKRELENIRKLYTAGRKALIQKHVIEKQ